MDFNDLYVEVNKDGSWYTALVHDFTDDNVEVHYSNTQLAPETVPYDKVRPMPESKDSKPVGVGNNCEVQISSKDDEVIGWVEGTVKDARGDFFVVEIKSNDQKQTEIVPSDRIRAVNTHECMEAGCLFRYRVHLNENLEELCRSGSDESHKKLKEHLSPARLYYDENTRELVLLTDSSVCLKRATMMIEMHLKCLDIKSAILRKSKNVYDRIGKRSSASHNTKHSCEFQLKESVMGLAIGSKGVNISNARQIPGIVAIETDHQTRTFRIFGDTEEAVNKARAMLEYEERTIMVPRTIISRIIGKNGSTIQDIVDRSQILRVKIEGDRDRLAEAEEVQDKVPLIFTGTVESINNAKILLDFYVAHITEIDELAKNYSKIMEDVRKMSPSTGPKQFRVPYQQNNGGQEMRPAARQMQHGNYRGNRPFTQPRYRYDESNNDYHRSQRRSRFTNPNNVEHATNDGHHNRHPADGPHPRMSTAVVEH